LEGGLNIYFLGVSFLKNGRVYIYGRTYLIERKSWIAWDGEIIVEGYVLDFFLCFSVRGILLACIPTNIFLPSLDAAAPT
jgi:hypothetical protein